MIPTTEGLAIISCVCTVLLFVLGTAGWAIKKWIQTQFEDNVSQLLPNLLNGDTPVAVYAHQARDAASQAKDAALDARDAASQSKDVAFEIRDLIKDLRKRTESYHVTHITEETAIATRDVDG